MQKIKNLVRSHSAKKIPEAPAAPAMHETAAPLAAAPLTSNTLLAQKEMLHEPAAGNNIYNNLVQDAALDRNGDGLNDLTGQRLSQGYVHNPLDRNFDGQVDINDLAGQRRLSQTYETTYVQSAQRSSMGVIRAEPTVLETIEKEVVIHERIHPVEKEEIQPIIYREREQLDVKQVTQLMHETQIQPTIIQERELAAEIREAVVERSEPIPQNIVLPTTQIEAVSRTQVVHAPIVEEVIKRTVIEEIQPVLERDVFQPVVIQNTQTIHEKIIEAPTVYREMREVRELGVTSSQGDAQLLRELGLTNGFPASGSRLSQNYSQQTTTFSSLDRNGDGRVDAQDLSGRRMSQGYSNESALLLQQQQLQQQQLLLQQQQLQQQQFLPTGQVLPQVASSRPAYSYLPQGYSEPRPNFIGTASQYVMAANGLPQSTLAHSKNLATVNPYAMGSSQPNSAPMFLGRQ